ncbi:cell division protein FtsQ/DivIB [Lactococcus kimchii]|uniref:cell division protein FtsQ/DivIB n=1 Tax=Lactococcus sp. S-13 TaxID=2507158 RepID=UPI0010234D15|nr:cell division protein FtsQ/DivIB [Lactococcus sp. S-13]RZI48798.1 FtsQ-type POTRA domain-containing protein [Lactococcus sp. S-13]
MSEKDNNLTPWQQKNLEYQRKKAAEAKKLEKEQKKEQSKKSYFSSPFLKNSSKSTETGAEAENPELPAAQEEQQASDFVAQEATGASQANEQILAQLDQMAQQVEQEREKRPSIFAGSGPILRKMWIALAVTVVVFLGSIYAVSPLSKIGDFKVSGNQSETIEQVATASKLKTGDSIFKIMKQKHQIEQNINQSFPKVAKSTLSYKFPNHFLVTIKEWGNAAYVKRNNQNYLVLENGYIYKTPQDPAKLEKLPILQDFSDDEVKAFVKAFEKLKPELRAMMTTVTKTPTEATKDFIAIDMSDGNQIRVPLSQMAVKVPYYPSVAKQVTAPQVIDMEAGIYTKPKAAYDAYLSDLSSSKAAASSAANEKKAATNSADTPQSTTESSSTN